MKTLLLLTLSFTLILCTAHAQPFNKEVTIEGKNPILLGKINKEILSTNTYVDWFLKNYDAYQPESTYITILKEKLPEYTITAFFGSWCGDSKEQLPPFYKILDEAKFPLERLTVVGVSRERDAYKQSPGGEEEGLNIHRVPTFIFYKDGIEVNRIVEQPIATLEHDMSMLLQNESYIPKYNSVTIVNNALKKMGTVKFHRKAKKLLPQLRKEVKNISELNTYSSVLFFADQKEEALAVAKLNTLLFPNEAYTYESLANKQFKTNSLEKALKNYETSLTLDPENERVKKSITTVKEKIGV
jgi:thiol-disulfide isomerase/thioredoxin|tara:strand:- start:2608 stop:3507 length:900 start_codon:yes stop_codon:yes gene_type:complete